MFGTVVAAGDCRLPKSVRAFAHHLFVILARPRVHIRCTPSGAAVTDRRRPEIDVLAGIREPLADAFERLGFASHQPSRFIGRIVGRGSRGAAHPAAGRPFAIANRFERLETYGTDR